MDLSLTFCKVFCTPNFWVEINNSNIKRITTSTLSSMIMFHKRIFAWASNIHFFGFNVLCCNSHSLTMLQLTPFESISKSMDFNNLSSNTHKRKILPIRFFRIRFILHTHYLMFVQFCFSTWHVRTTSTCKQTCACLYIYEIIFKFLFNFES
jgi:hypothetical protein